MNECGTELQESEYTKVYKKNPHHASVGSTSGLKSSSIQTS